MSKRKRWIGAIIGVFVIIGVGATAYALTFPAAAVCVAIGAYGFEAVSDRIFVPPNSSPVQKAGYEALIREARERIKDTFGEPRADPIIVFFDDPRSFSPLFLNEFGQTPRIGERTCVIIGPRGQDVDVVSHELMHTEIHHRVGAWGMFREIPTWFDEGVAMQVDYRNRYLLEPQDTRNPNDVRALTSFSSFFVADDEARTRNYASAKKVIALWLAEVGPTALYPRLQRLKNGESFSDIFPEQEPLPAQ